VNRVWLVRKKIMNTLFTHLNTTHLSKMTKLITLAASAAFTLSASAAISVTNGAFDGPHNTGGDVPDWLDSTGGWSSFTYNDGDSSRLTMGADGWVYQSLGTLDPGSTGLDWQIDVASTNGGSYAFEIEFFAGDFAAAGEGVDILGHASQPTTLGGPTTFGVDTLGTFNGLVDTSAVAAGTEIWVRIHQSNGAYERLDNLQVAAVPEPSSVALLGLGGLALILRRRK